MITTDKVRLVLGPSIAGPIGSYGRSRRLSRVGATSWRILSSFTPREALSFATNIIGEVMNCVD
jgi:hypothetical protein